MPSVVSLFSGCGGLDLGFKKYGFDLLYAADNDQFAVDVYRRNVDERAFVRDVTSEHFHQEIADIGCCDVVLGGFPCQGFSKAGPKRVDDARNTLYLEMKRAISTLMPKIFVAENVDGLSQNFGGQFVENITKDFGALGYSVSVKIVNAAAYGVPQHRRRIIFVGLLNPAPHNFYWPPHTNSVKNRNGESALTFEPSLFNSAIDPADLPRSRTIRDAIGDIVELGGVPDHAVTEKWPREYDYIFKAIGPGQKLCNVRHAPTSVYTWKIPEVFGVVNDLQKEILETIGANRRLKKYGQIPNGNPISKNEIEYLMGGEAISDFEFMDLEEKGYLKNINGAYDLKGAMFCSGIFKRPLWDESSPTVLTNFHSPRYFLHPSENRPFSLREAARLQSFPDDFIFTTSNDPSELLQGYRVVGNAVPPLLAESIASSVVKMF